MRRHGVELNNGGNEHGKDVAVGCGSVSGMVILTGSKIDFGTGNGVTEIETRPGDDWVGSGVRFRNLLSKSDRDSSDDLQGFNWLGAVDDFGVVFNGDIKWEFNDGKLGREGVFKVAEGVNKVL